jgi:hypothetical protein
MIEPDSDYRPLALDLNQETARIAWRELQRFFARGVTIAVAPELDLLLVASEIAGDNKAAVAAWMETRQLAAVSDEQARQWLDADAQVWSVVVKPWVLVQPVDERQR